MIRKITLLFLLFIGIQTAVKAQTTVSIGITSGDDSSCIGNFLTFTANPTTGTVNPQYQWYLNGVATGVTTQTYTDFTFANLDNVYCHLIYDSLGFTDSVQSNTVIVYRFATLTPTVTIALTNGNNPGCANYLTTFTAFPDHGGIPVYQWAVNGVDVPGADSIIFTRILNNNDIVSVTMVSGLSCATPPTASSNTIPIIHQHFTSTNTIVPSQNPNCQGHSDTLVDQLFFPGSSYTLQWFVNGVAVPGVLTDVYITDSLHDGDVVTTVLYSPDTCITNTYDTSAGLVMMVNQAQVPEFFAQITAGANPGCLDSLVEFTGSVVNLGPNVNFEWLVNGVAVASGSVFQTSTLVDGDTVILRANQTDGGCYTVDTGFAPIIIMHLDTTPSNPLISLIGNILVANQGGSYLWYGPDGLIPGQTGQTLHPDTIGEYYARYNDDNCLSTPSNILTVALLEVKSYNLDNVKIYPNPTHGQLVLDWGTQSVNMKADVYNLLGQGLLHDEINNQSRKTIDLSVFPTGNYFIVLKDQDGSTGTVQVTLTK